VNRKIRRCAGYIRLLCCMLVCPATYAAPDVLDRVDITQGDDQSTIHIHLNIPVSYRSHAPKHSGDFLRISVEPLPSTNNAGDVLLGAEYIQWNASRQVPLLDVIYVGEGIGNTAISLRFQSDVQFEVVKTADIRMLNVVVKHPQTGRLAATDAGLAKTSILRTTPAPVNRDQAKPAPVPVAVPALPYVINLASSIQPFRPEALPQLEEFTTYRLYTTRFNKDGKIWNRLRLGFFKSSAAATAVMNGLKRYYPRAWIDKASTAERSQSGESMLVASARGRVAAVAPPVQHRQVTDAAVTEPAGGARLPVPQATGPAVPAERLNELMDTARQMMTAKDYAGAIRIYTKVTQSAGNRYSQEALEFLGLAREYKGQQAQAKHVYEQYLERYPEGEGAERVRQRLAALLTASKQPREKLRAPRGVSREQASVWDVFGGFSQFYRRDQNTAGINEDNEATTVTQSSVDSNVDVTARRRSGDYDVRTRFTGGYLHDFLDEGVSSDTTVSSLYLDAQDRKRELSMRLGRQSRSSGGVLGRFDGLLLGFPLGKKLAASAVGGYPVQSSTDNLDTDRYFYGLSLAASGFAEGWDANVFTIEQRAGGSVDRRAVGGELRYFDAGHSFFSLVDYDIYYNELNIGQFLGNWIFPDKTTLSLTLDYRNSPILTTYNALTGQGVDSLDALQDIYTDSEIQDLARDRTATSKLATLGVSHPLSENLQVSGDVTATRLSGTPASGGVVALEGTGTDYFYNLQLIGSNLIKTGDITILGVRYSDTENSGITSLFLNTRYPFNSDLRINPRFRIDYRDNRNDGTDQIIYRPSMLLAYQLRRRLRLEAEFGGEYSDREVVDGSQKDASYYINIGYRSDF